MLKQVLKGLQLILLCGIVACSSQGRSVEQDITKRVYVGFASGDTNEQEVATTILRKAIKPQGPWSTVPAWLDVDVLSSNHYVVYGGAVQRTSYQSGLHRKLSQQVVEKTAEREDPTALYEGLKRLSYILKQSNDNTQVYAVIVTKGIGRSDDDTASAAQTNGLELLIQAIASEQQKLARLCLYGVQGEVRTQTGALFEGIPRDKVTVVSLQEEISNCLP